MMCNIFQKFLERRKPKKSRFCLKEIPIPGNAFITKFAEDDESDESKTGEPACRGSEHWTSSKTVWTIYFRIGKPDAVIISLLLRIPEGKQSSFNFSWNDEPSHKHKIIVHDSHGGEDQHIVLRNRVVKKPGYLGISFQGLERTGDIFAEVNHLLVNHGISDNEIIYNSIHMDPFTGRKGPLVKLNYLNCSIENKNLDCYYCEVTIPRNSDVPGLHAIAIGFSGGSLALQVDGKFQRQIIFTVHSSYDKDSMDCKQEPEDLQVTLIKEGDGSHVRCCRPDAQTGVGIFGETKIENKNLETQSVVTFNLLAATTYKFLVQSKPIDFHNTEYSAWIRPPKPEPWTLIARFRKPKGNIYLSGFYSSLSNLEPDKGHVERSVYYGNQWVRDSSKKWHEIAEADFTVDPVSTAGRMDYAAGCVGGGSGSNLYKNHFFLRHCGFFSDTVPMQKFVRKRQGRVPIVDVDSLHQN